MRPRIHDLDRNETYVALDPSGLRHRLKTLPMQCRAAWDSCKSLEFPGHWLATKKVIIGGMGGSAIAGDLVNDLAILHQAVSIVMVRDLCLPFKLDETCLFIACSYSGTTEETLSLFRQVSSQQIPTLAITGGGTLSKEASEARIPVLSINSPGEPRSAVGYNLMALLGALNKAGIMAIADEDVQDAVSVTEEQITRYSEEVPSSDNPAKLLAQQLVDKLVVVYGGGLFSAMARRWKTQLNENAKAWAFFETIPELLHNSVEAYSSSLADGESMNVLLLQPSEADQALNIRYEVVRRLLHRRNIPHRVLKAPGQSPLAQILNMLVLGDYVSYYLALLKGLDPSPTPTLQLGKELLTGG